MRYSLRIAGMGSFLIATGTLLAQPPAGSVGTTRTPSTSARNQAGLSSESALLCAGLLGSGALADIFTVAPLTQASRGDPNTSIQFGPIWSEAHQTQIGSTPSRTPPSASPAVAFIRLPIAFSPADRQRFEAAGWRPRPDDSGHGPTYCLERSARGMVCVAAAAEGP